MQMVQLSEVLRVNSAEEKESGQRTGEVWLGMRAASAARAFAAVRRRLAGGLRRIAWFYCAEVVDEGEGCGELAAVELLASRTVVWTIFAVTT